MVLSKMKCTVSTENLSGFRTVQRQSSILGLVFCHQNCLQIHFVHSKKSVSVHLLIFRGCRYQCSHVIGSKCHNSNFMPVETVVRDSEADSHGGCLAL